MRKAFFRFGALGLLTLVLLLGAFSTVAQQSDVLTIAVHEDMKGATNFIASNNGQNNTVWNRYVLGGSHMSLYGLTPVSNQPFPLLAADFASPFEQEGDFFTSTVELLQGVQWTDGTEVTADDVAFSYNNMVRPVEATGRPLAQELGGSFSQQIDAAFLERVDVVDDHTVKFVLKEVPGFSIWEFNMLQAWVFQKAFWEDRFEQAFASEDPVLTLSSFEVLAEEPINGPFAFVDREPGAFAEVGANPNYFFKGRIQREYSTGGYEEVLPDGTTRSVGDISGELILEVEEGPFVDSVVYSLFGSQGEAAQAVIDGVADFQLNNLGFGLASIRDFQSAENVGLAENPDSGFFYMSFNLRKAPFNYLAFRKAVRCVLDIQAVAEQQLSGQVIPAYSTVAQSLGSWHEDLLADEANREAACIGLSEQDKIARARQMLTDAGFEFDGNRLARDPEGNAIRQLELLHPNAAYDNNRNIYGLHINDRLNKLGIPVRDVPAGFNNIVTLVFAQQDFDMWQLGWTGGVEPTFNVVDLFTLENTQPNGNAAQGGVCSPRENADNGCQDRYEELANQFKAATSVEEAIPLAIEMQQAIFDNVAYIPTHNTIQFDAYRADQLDFQGLAEASLLNGLQFNDGYREFVRLK